MNIENFIEAQYQDLNESGLNLEFSNLYAGVAHLKLREVLSTLHYDLVQSFKTMNERLPAGDIGAHFWAEPSRALIRQIEITLGLYNVLKNSKYAFEIDTYYYELIFKSCSFLSSSGGSTLPANIQKVELYYIQPIFIPVMGITVTNIQSGMVYELKQIGSGSYANVYKYKDTFYNRQFVLKRAKKDLSSKEIQRFKREYEEMQEFSSPYILEVYCYNSEKMNILWSIWTQPWMSMLANTMTRYLPGNAGCKAQCFEIRNEQEQAAGQRQSNAAQLGRLTPSFRNRAANRMAKKGLSLLRELELASIKWSMA